MKKFIFISMLLLISAFVSTAQSDTTQTKFLLTPVLSDKLPQADKVFVQLASVLLLT